MAGLVHQHNWRGLQDPHNRVGWENHQASDLGHRGPGALPHDQQHLLSWRPWHHRGVRRDQQKLVRQRERLARGDQQVRARECVQVAGGQQVGPGHRRGAPGPLRRGQGVCGQEPHALPRDLRQERQQRRDGFPHHGHGDQEQDGKPDHASGRAVWQGERERPAEQAQRKQRLLRLKHLAGRGTTARRTGARVLTPVCWRSGERAPVGASLRCSARSPLAGRCRNGGGGRGAGP
mmetsp:Transcript_23772/g.70045  ORF Transcript_23772/g.70045 Transcript_23772/m.70045 type:complete len:234 (-) Transcript_23772:268-969(-)